MRLGHHHHDDDSGDGDGDDDDDCDDDYDNVGTCSRCGQRQNVGPFYSPDDGVPNIPDDDDDDDGDDNDDDNDNNWTVSYYISHITLNMADIRAMTLLVLDPDLGSSSTSRG